MKSSNRTGSRIDWMKMVGFEIKKYKTWSACFKKTFGYLEQSSLSWLLFRLTTLHFFVMRLCWIFEPFSSTGLHNGIKITHNRNAYCVFLFYCFPQKGCQSFVYLQFHTSFTTRRPTVTYGGCSHTALFEHNTVAAEQTHQSQHHSQSYHASNRSRLPCTCCNFKRSKRKENPHKDV